MYFDLIGLPPSSDEIKAFLDDSDRCLRQGRGQTFGQSPFREVGPSLDGLARYAETCGHEFDYPREHPHEYRDYLIRAFNDDPPYDQLLVEHAVGDLMDEPRLNAERKFNESIIGTGFGIFMRPCTPHRPQAGQRRPDRKLLDVFWKTFLV